MASYRPKSQVTGHLGGFGGIVREIAQFCSWGKRGVGGGGGEGDIL